MSTLTLGIIVIIYMFVIAWLGYLGYRQTKNASDYLLGGRKVNPIIMALSYGATFISASAIVGFGGVAATFGMGIQWLCLLNMFMGVVVAFIFFVFISILLIASPGNVWKPTCMTSAPWPALPVTSSRYTRKRRASLRFW